MLLFCRCNPFSSVSLSLSLLWCSNNTDTNQIYKICSWFLYAIYHVVYLATVYLLCAYDINLIKYIYIHIYILFIFKLFFSITQNLGQPRQPDNPDRSSFFRTVDCGVIIDWG